MAPRTEKTCKKYNNINYFNTYRGPTPIYNTLNGERLFVVDSFNGREQIHIGMREKE
jgi:hypothetical protein